MKKVVVSLLIIAASIMVLSSCAGKEKNPVFGPVITEQAIKMDMTGALDEASK